jgi:tetratricopeptide (TPR) repeat protein
MGNPQGKGRNSKLQDFHNNPPKTIQYDASWVDTIGRSFVVVWCDAAIGSNPNSDDDSNTLMQLASIVNKKRQLIHTFNELDACQNFITHANNIFLIVSGQMGQSLVPLVHDLDQIHSIYIFCINKPKYDAWAKPYKKIRGVHTDIKAICECLKTYFTSHSSAEHDFLQFDVLNKDMTFPSVDKQEFLFLYPILSKIILLNNTSIRHQDMINYCRMEYTSDYQIPLINDFETNYSQHDPVWWFTRDNFFQGIINRALQIHDFYILCTMTPFLKDLDMKLVQLHRKEKIPISTTLHLYSTQPISIDDFNKLKTNQGGLLCINQYIFANTEQDIALLFIDQQNSASTHTNNMNILLEISIPQSIDANVSYANIGVVSQFVHQKEYLISMSSIYRIGKIEPLMEIPTGWVVHLTLIDKNDAQLDPIIQLIDRDQLYRDNNLPKLGSTIINKLYHFKSTPKLFEQALSFRTKQIRPILLHYNMGIIYDCLHEYNQALEEYNYAKALTRNAIPNGHQKDSLCLIPLFSSIGLTYQRLNLSSHAFDHGFRALAILSNNQENSVFRNEISASSHFILGLILDLQKKYSEAIIYYQQALRDRQEYLPDGHPDVLSLQNTITSLNSEEVIL